MGTNINLHGRVFVECQVQTITGLHIGAAETAMAIGGVDNVVVRDTLTQHPYIPGSSLKGKMRSLMEKFHGAAQNRRIGRGVKIHVCESEESYGDCAICRLYGLPGELQFARPTRLIVRDMPLSEESVEKLEAAKTDLPFTEVKWEAAIDRVTSAATPRQLERVPAGAVFSPVEMIYTVYEAGDIDRFEQVVQGMALLEDDYLGGLGSRGSGKVAFKEIAIRAKSRDNYSEVQMIGDTYPSLKELQEALPSLLDELKSHIPIKGA